MTDLPFKAHYTDDAGEIQCRAFATNAEAREFRATLVDGKLPKAEDKPGDKLVGLPVETAAPAAEPAVPLTNDATSAPAIVSPPSSTAAVLNGPKVAPSATGASG